MAKCLECQDEFDGEDLVDDLCPNCFEEPEEIDNTCYTCRGTGEGMHDGAEI